MKLNRCAVAILVFMACSAVMACILASLLHGVSHLVAVASLITGFAAAVGAWFSDTNEAPNRPLKWLDWIAIVFFSAVCLRAFLWLVYADDDHLMVLSPNNLGDLTKHWNYIRYIAQGCKFWPDNPLLAGSTIRYPFGIDLFNSLLLVCGVPIIRGLVWVALGGCMLTGIALYKWGGTFTLTGFLCNGGLIGFLFFKSFDLHDYQAEIPWKNIFLSMMVTQRGFLFCLPAGLFLLDSWKKRWQGSERHLPLWIEVIFYAAMPLFHFHTFMFLSGLLGVWLLFGTNVIRGYTLKLGLISLIPASLLTLLVTDFFKGPSVFKFQPGWMQGSTPFFEFWFVNFGILIPACLTLCVWLLIKRDQRLAISFVLPACVMFLLCCLFLFAPWEWDNTKLMIWAYLAVLPFLWDCLIAQRRYFTRIIFCIFLFFSGFVSLIGGLKDPGHEIATRSELDAISGNLSKIPISERFAASPVYNHPLLLLGRKVGMAYTGYLYGHGLPYEKAEDDLNQLMHGEPGWEDAAQELQVTYLFWGSREDAMYPDSTRPWAATTGSIVAQGVWGTIYKLGK